MSINEKKINKLFIHWLNVSLILVFLIIIVGGLTRLTNSGLSITEWELFEGLLPPLNQNSWNKYFNLYQQIPQFKLINFNMTLDEFKVIFYWEYAHRIIARVIGIFFLVPLIFFYFSKKINYKYLNVCTLIFILIILQGVVGWYMVKSGLVYDTTVSHYRLSIHLSIAILIISSIFWLLKNFKSEKYVFFFKFSKKKIPFQILLILIFTQIVFGAFVSGLDAGKIYQTWPMMGDKYFPNDLYLNKLAVLLNFDNHSLVQFYHRNLGYLIVLYALSLLFYIYTKNYINLFKPAKILVFVLFIQVSLGIFTLVSGLNIYLASLHQITGVLLVLSALNLYYLRAK